MFTLHKGKYDKLAFVCMPEDGEKLNLLKNASVYCHKLVDMGYIPICPTYMFSTFLFSIFEEEREAIAEMSREMAQKCDVIVACGDTMTLGMAELIDFIENETYRKIPVTTLDGLEEVYEVMQKAYERNGGGECTDE